MNRQAVGDILWGLAIAALALALSFARRLGHVDQDTVMRIVIAANGLLIARFGNRMPKAFVPNPHARRAMRVGGWALVLSGLAFAGFWLFAPMPVASIGSVCAVVVGIAVTLGYCLTLRGKAKADA